MAGERPTDAYEFGQDRVEWFERFDVEPVAPDAIRERLEGDEQLVTLDLPSHLGKGVTVDGGISLVLYRLVQLFGTPNVPGLEAGGDQPDREKTTWQYLFRVRYAGGDDEPDRDLLVSVYDYKTNFSVGLSRWRTPDDPSARAVPEAVEEGVDLPDDLLGDEEFLVGVVQLFLHVVEQPVEATFKGLSV